LFYHSDKIKNDLETALKFPKLWDVEIIVREFNPHVQLENEYRGFVYENQLNALSQYDIKVKFSHSPFFSVITHPSLKKQQKLQKELKTFGRIASKTFFLNSNLTL
jgi:hypothetical protein